MMKLKRALKDYWWLYLLIAFALILGWTSLFNALDRIRDNEKVYGIDDIDGLVDRSIRETMTRSINTVAATLVAILALYIFSVDAIRDFALPIIVGILCGCYSSIFVASPLWVLFQKKFGKSRFNVRQSKKFSKRSKNVPSKKAKSGKKQDKVQV